MHDDLERLERERLDADRRYNDALTSFDHAVSRVNGRTDLSREDVASIATALIVYLQQITAFIDTKDRALTARLSADLSQHQRALDVIPELRTQIAVLQRTVKMLKRGLAEGSAEAATAAPAPRTAGAMAGPPEPRQSRDAATDVTYIGFEDRFRGTPDE